MVSLALDYTIIGSNNIFIIFKIREKSVTPTF